ncbi:MAG: RNA polymerase sigma factor [Ktedonobacterales bacterium]
MGVDPGPDDAMRLLDVLDAWRRGEEEGVRTVFASYYPRAVRLAALSGLHADEAQTCAQDAFTRAFERREQLRDLRAFPLWFHRIVTRAILDTLAARHADREVALDAVGDLAESWARESSPQPEALALAAEQRAAVWERIQRLPTNYRVPLVLRYYGDFSVREVAEMMDLREGTLRVTLSRALARLRLDRRLSSLSDQPGADDGRPERPFPEQTPATRPVTPTTSARLRA